MQPRSTSDLTHIGAACNNMSASDEELLAIPETPLQSETESGRSSVEGIEIQFVGTLFEYTIPNFSCISFTLRQITFEAFVDGSISTYDGFIRHDPSLDKLVSISYPKTIDVLESCFVKVY